MARYVAVAARRILLFLTENYLVFPRLLFVITYFSLIHQLSHYAFPARRRGNLSEWMLSLAIITQANETWKYIMFLVEYTLRLCKKGEPAMLFNKMYLLPMVDIQALRVVMSIVMACLPWIISYFLEKRQRRFRGTWLDIRRRYRNEIGSARYYLTRPLTPPAEPNTKTRVTKSRSAEVLPRTIKPLPKMPRTA